MENQQAPKPALPLLVLLGLASALGVAVAIALAGVAMLLAAPAYADEGSLLLVRQGGMAEAELVFEQAESHEDGAGVRTRILAEFYNPFAEQLTGLYLYRLPGNAVLERLTFAVLPRDGEEISTRVTAQPALLTLREGAAVIERPWKSVRVKRCASRWSIAPEPRGACLRSAGRSPGQRSRYRWPS